ncbi:MAG TPA: GNAT family N-acetyltransferase [Candidatus Limnocylindrales bacterium]|nr:GNAT family N-acetyltransferase [Candidatus Limnocylindrales bacterium]
MSVAPVLPADVLGTEPQDWPLTIGVALPIPEPFLGELGAYRERFGDPLAHSIVAHITLVPPTQVADEEHLAAILGHLQVQAASMEPFPLVLEGAGTFRPVSQVVFVPIVEGEDQVREAEAAVRQGPLDRALNFPYHPHVTVAHDLEEEWLDRAQDALAAYRAAFEVDRLSLFIQGADAVWRPVVDFPFGQSIIDPLRYAGDSVTIGVLDPDEFPDLCDRLGEIVADAVASGAGVNFMLPFSAQDGAAWWHDQAGDVASGRRVLLVARDAGEVVGTVSLYPAVAPNQPHRAELSKLMVHSADRRRGVATRLMDAAAAEARERGFTLLTLDCVAGGPEQEFYQGLGYVPVGTIPGYALSPTGEPQDTTILYLELR